MKGASKLIITICLTISMVFIPWSAALARYDGNHQEPTTESMIGDAVVARPLGLISTVVGSVFFVVSLPFSALGGNTGEAARKMVVDPAKFIFKRPLGEF
jgi:hypothetical protein